MSFISRMTRQTATWWARQSLDSYNDPTFAAPVVLSYAAGTGVRWEQRAEKFINSHGEEEQCHAVVWSATTSFGLGDYLYLGSSVAVNPESVTGADQIRLVQISPDIGNHKSLYKAFL